MVKAVPNSPNRAQPSPGNRVCGGISQVQQGDFDRGLHLVGDLVHRVGADQQQLGAAGFQAFGGRGEQLAGLVPPAVGLQPLDFREVHRPERHAGRAQRTFERTPGAA
jgi:hypothetical protein